MPVEQLIYTDRPRGKGVNPASAGYQIKACSDGLNAEARDLLSSIGMHYGDAVYQHAPRSARNREQDWRATTDNIASVPDDVLNEFPVIWSYDRLADDAFALTRVCYAGLTHDGRPGNFFAHALAFAPAALMTSGANPLALSRSKLFRSADASDETQLPVLLDLEAPPAPPDSSVLREAPYRDRLGALLSALAAATPATRPLLLRLADWRQAAPLVEALLNFLPPAARCQTTFCTYESDRTWLASTKAGRPTGLVAAHHLVVMGGVEERSFNLRPDEIQSRYAVFDFVGNQFSDLGEPRRFARFAAARMLDGYEQALVKLHDLIEQFGVGADSNAWDALVPVADLREGERRPEMLVEAVRALTTIATEPRQAEAAYQLLLRHVELLAKAEEHSALALLQSELATLANRLPKSATSSLQSLAGDMLAQGRARTAAALLGACGQSRDQALFELLQTVLNQPPVTAPEADREPWLNLWLEGLRLAQNAPEAVPDNAPWLVAVFRAAREAERLPSVWSQIGETVVKPSLSGEWNAAKQTLTHDLLAQTPALLCPEANAWLNLRLLEMAKPQGEQLLALLVDTAAASARCADAETLTVNLLRLAGERLADRAPEHQAEALGRLAEAAHPTASGEKIFAAYREALHKTTPNRHNQVRRNLAEAGAMQVLSREFLAEVLPWQEADSLRKLQHWRDVVLAQHPALMDGLRQTVADLLGKPGQGGAAWPLAEALLPRLDNNAAAKPGALALYQALAFALPLTPDSWRPGLSAPPNGLAPEASARLRILKFMHQVKTLASEPDWAVTRFPYAEPAWSQDVRALIPETKLQVLTWCISTFETVGVTIPEEAQGLLKLLDVVDERPAIAEVVTHLLKGRDPVTSVLVIMAFARCGLEGPKSHENWGGIVKAILARQDKVTRQLLEEHLARRFGRRDEKYEDRLQRLCEAAGLALPRPIASDSTRVGRSAAPATDASETKAGFQVGNLLTQARRSLQRLVGGTEEGEKPAGPSEEKPKKPGRGRDG